MYVAFTPTIAHMTVTTSVVGAAPAIKTMTNARHAMQCNASPHVIFRQRQNIA